MTGAIKVTVQGLRELDQALGQFTKATARAVLRRTGIKALQPFDKRWRELAPDDPSTPSNDLKSSGGVGTKLTERQARLNRRREDKSFVEVFAGPNDRAAIVQEFGTVAHPPQPFVRPAWAQTKGEALEIVRTELRTEIDKTAKRLAARARKGK
jgi:HK97 gp10 family phage protein